jgi:hypothetical protein
MMNIIISLSCLHPVCHLQLAHCAKAIPEGNKCAGPSLGIQSLLSTTARR